MAAMSRKSRRLFIIGGMGGVLALAAALVLTALSDDIVFFRSPSDIVRDNVADGVQLRMGGLVETGSVVRSSDGLEVSFLVTDGAEVLPVAYRGILPDLFREGQGVVVEGRMQDGTFHAASVLAKHDENYMPREVQAALEAGGHPAAAKTAQ
jgi:cytochrome c-type biogenesis protein CcmE